MVASTLRRLSGVALALAAVLVIVHEYPRALPGEGLWDFGSFVASGRAAREGLNPYGIYPLTLHVVLPGFEAWNPNLNPPISALLFQLFDWADPNLSFRVWWGISVLCFATTLVLLLRRYRPRQPVALVLWAFGLAGFWDTLVLGQIYLPLVLLGSIAWVLLEQGRAIPAGILIGLVVSMKPNFLVWPALLLLSGAAVPALVSFATAAVVALVPLVALGPEVYRQWVELVLSDRERAAFLTNASLSGIAARMGLPSAGLVLSAMVLVACAWWAVRRRPGVTQASAVGLAAGILASPIGWVHYTLMLLPVFVKGWQSLPLRLVGLLLLVPVPYMIDAFGSPAWVQVTWGSVYGWAVLLCFLILIRAEPSAAGPEAHATPEGLSQARRAGA